MQVKTVFEIRKTTEDQTDVFLWVEGSVVCEWSTSRKVEPKNDLEAVCKKYLDRYLVKIRPIGPRLEDLEFSYSVARGRTVWLTSGGVQIGSFSEGDARPTNDVERVCKEELDRWREELGMEELDS